MIDSFNLYRLAVFVIIFGLMWGWERRAGYSKPKHRISQRWANNLLVSIINTFSLKLLGPLSAISVSLWAETHNIGLLNKWALPTLAAMVITWVVLDFAIYTQHYLAHRWTWFWRIHRMHHADPFFDVSTAIRFHPVEILVSAFIKMAFILLLGAPIMAIVLFEMILSGMAMFNHGNVSITPSLESRLRFFIVTPDMHRIHHSQRAAEHHSNFGFNLTLWDRLFGTYTQRQYDQNFRIGLPEFTDTKINSSLLGMLTIPLRSDRPKNQSK